MNNSTANKEKVLFSLTGLQISSTHTTTAHTPAGYCMPIYLPFSFLTKEFESLVLKRLLTLSLFKNKLWVVSARIEEKWKLRYHKQRYSPLISLNKHAEYFPLFYKVKF